MQTARLAGDGENAVKRAPHAANDLVDIVIGEIRTSAGNCSFVKPPRKSAGLGLSRSRDFDARR